MALSLRKVAAEWHSEWHRKDTAKNNVSTGGKRKGFDFVILNREKPLFALALGLFCFPPKKTRKKNIFQTPSSVTKAFEFRTQSDCK